MLNSVLHLVPCMINLAKPCTHRHHFLITSSQMPSHVIYFTACSSTLFSCAPENLVSRDGFGSPIPRHLFITSEIGSTRVRAIRPRAAGLYSRARLRIWSRATVSAVPSRFTFFCTVRNRIDTGSSDQIPGRTASFSCVPENLVSRDRFGSPVPRQLFFLYRSRSDRHGYERSNPGPHTFIHVRA